MNNAIYSLFSIVGSYESTNCPSTNWILKEDLPVKKKIQRNIENITWNFFHNLQVQQQIQCIRLI